MNIEKNSMTSCKKLKYIEMQQNPVIRCQKVNVTKPIIHPDEIKTEYSDCKNFPKTSECHDKYATPLRKKRAVTRESLLENFWWHEFYEEYLRELYRGIDIPKMPNSEYVDHYGKDAPIQANVDEIINRYPVYASNAITCYNTSGDKTQNFRKKYSITRPVSEQFDTQFG